MKAYMRAVTFKSSERYKQVEIMPITPADLHTSARNKKIFASSLVQQKLNGRNRQRYLTLLVNANFTEGDYLLTPTYADEFLPADFEEAEANLVRYLRRVRAACRRKGLPAPAYIAVTEGGSEQQEATGDEIRYHHHCILRCGLSVDEVRSLWSTGRGAEKQMLGYCDPKRAQLRNGSLEEWAAYMLKAPKHRRHWHQSLGLKKPSISVSDSKYTRRKINRAGHEGILEEPETWEREYPGWRCSAARAAFNEYTGSWYIRVELWRNKKDGDK